MRTEGWAGISEEVTVKVRAGEVPQVLVPVTETVPPVLPGITVMLSELLVPDQSEGSVQVYTPTLVSATTE